MSPKDVEEGTIILVTAYSSKVCLSDSMGGAFMPLEELGLGNLHILRRHRRCRIAHWFLQVLEQQLFPSSNKDNTVMLNR